MSCSGIGRKGGHCWRVFDTDATAIECCRANPWILLKLSFVSLPSITRFPSENRFRQPHFLSFCFRGKSLIYLCTGKAVQYPNWLFFSAVRPHTYFQASPRILFDCLSTQTEVSTFLAMLRLFWLFTLVGSTTLLIFLSSFLYSAQQSKYLVVNFNFSTNNSRTHCLPEW